MVKVGLLGLGNVGMRVYNHYLINKEHISRAIGDDIAIERIAVREVGKDRGVEVPPELLTTDPWEIVNVASTDVIISVLGNTELEKDLIEAALKRGKRVVTANKFTIARYGRELFRVAREYHSEILFEAAVCGGIQLVDNLLTRYVSNVMTGAFGILNGTTNYMLGLMAEGMSYDAALAKAVMEGYAEPDPTADVSGADAACKLAIIAGLMGGGWVDPDLVPTEGITKLSVRDFQYAREFGYVIKLIASCKLSDHGAAQLMVAPTLVWHEHPLAYVGNALNAVYLEGMPIRMGKLEGYGAGGDPTAASVWSDTVDAASHVLKGYTQPMPNLERTLGLVIPSQITNQHYLRMVVRDQKGCTAAITGVLAKHGIGIDQMLQPRNAKNRAKGLAETVFLTELSEEGSLLDAVSEIRSLDYCVKVGSKLRVLETPPGPDEDLEEE